MNLLYISNLSNNVDAGLNWSVPASVKAQQKYDNVLWVDLTKSAYQSHWSEVKAYKNIKEFGSKIKLDVLPAPFNNPDCVIFDGFYYMEHVDFSKELRKKKVPYIIVPRSAFTEAAFNNGAFFKRLKKKVAHFLIFDVYIKKSLSIQYLTQEEKKESEKRYKHRSFIVPNGIIMPVVKKEFSNNQIRGVFIGRQDIYQKGLDFLLEAIAEIHSELKESGFHLDIYGPPRYDYKQVSKIIEDLGISDLVTNHEKGVRGKDKESVLLSSDVFFLTSRFEGHPMGLIEALSYGVPALITRGANMYDEILETQSGWVSEITKEGIVNSLKKMIEGRKDFESISRNAMTLAERYDWDSLALRFHNNLVHII